MINLQDSIKMKKILLYIIIFIGFSQTTWAQQELKRANDFFEKTYYADAIILYEAALPRNKSSKLIKNLADCYYHTFDLKSSARWYRYLISNYGETIEEEYYFKLNQSLKAIGEYAEAETILIDYYTKQGDETKLQLIKKNSKYLENVKALGNRFKIENSAFNTTTSEFGAMQVGSQIWYTATHKKPVSKTYRWNNENYLNIYAHPLDKQMLGDSLSISLSKNINTKLHEGAFTVSSDGKTIYFTRNNSKNGKRNTDGNKISNLKIYNASLIDSKWENITELPFNSDDYSNEHPSLNADGTKLYFASDRPGGFGSFDIYEVTLQPNNTYSTPLNLGSNINTETKEQFPFVAPDNSLYFSSNGHAGFGLLDVFISKNENGKFLKPDNLGFPVNSGYDDFSISINADGKTGYFASNRPTGKGSDDIYTFSETLPLIIEDCKQYITGIITNRTTTLALSEVEISLIDAQNNLVTSFKTKENGSFKFEVICESSYTVKADKKGFESNYRTISTDKERNSIKDASMDLYSSEEKEKAEQITLQKKINEEKIKAEALAVKQLKEEKKAEQILAQQQVEEKIRIEKEKIAEKVKTEKAMAKRITDALATESALVKEKDRTIIKTEEIHFDYSLWYLRRESRERLQTVIQVMKNNSGIIIEIGTHTDIRGNSNYNKDLSQKRADSAKEFLIKNGIAPERIVSVGYGESKPIVKCSTEDSCSEEDHEWNRRCEFIVVAWDYQEKSH